MEKSTSRALTTIDGELVSSMIPKEANSVIRVTLANIEEANILLQNGLDFYGATFFPTELATPAQAAKLIKPSRYLVLYDNRLGDFCFHTNLGEVNTNTYT